MGKQVQVWRCRENRWFGRIGVAALLLGAVIPARPVRGDYLNVLPEAWVSGFTSWCHCPTEMRTKTLDDFGSTTLYYTHPDLGTFSSEIEATEGAHAWVSVSAVGSSMWVSKYDPIPPAQSIAQLTCYFAAMWQGEGDPPNMNIPIQITAGWHINVERLAWSDAVRAQTIINYAAFDRDGVRQRNNVLVNTWLWFNRSVSDSDLPGPLDERRTFDEWLNSYYQGQLVLDAMGQIDSYYSDRTGGKYKAWVDPEIRIDPTATMWVGNEQRYIADMFSLQVSRNVPQPSMATLLAAGAFSLIVYGCGRRRLARSRLPR